VKLSVIKTKALKERLKVQVWNLGVIEPHEEGHGHAVDRATHDPWLQQKLQIVMRWKTGKVISYSWIIRYKLSRFLPSEMTGSLPFAQSFYKNIDLFYS
jgi:hypothetical protein